MADFYKASVLIFDNKMKHVLLIKAPRMCAPSILAPIGVSLKTAVEEGMLGLLGILKEYQPVWWHFRTEVYRDEDSNPANHLVFGKLTDKEFAQISDKRLVSVGIGGALRTKLLHQQLYYWIPMAIYLADVPSHKWPRV